MSADVSRALVDLARAFSTLDARWYVFGAQAVVAAGVPRLTADIDVTVEVALRDLGALLAALRGKGIIPREPGDLARFVAETRVVPVVHRASRLPIDVVLAGPGLEEEMLSRVRIRKVRRVPIPFVDTADLVAMKVLAGRPKDLEDVRALVRAAPPDLDVRVARERIARLAAILEDAEMVSTFDALVVPARPSKTAPAPRAKPRRRAPRTR